MDDPAPAPTAPEGGDDMANTEIPETQRRRRGAFGGWLIGAILVAGILWAIIGMLQPH